MQRLEHTSIWWERRGGHVLLFWRIRLDLAYRVVMAYAIISGVSFLLTPLYLLRSMPVGNRARAILLFAAMTAGFALIAWLMHGMTRWVPHLYVRRKALPIGRGLRLVAVRENVTLPTGMGGTMPGGIRIRIYLESDERSRVHKLSRATAEPNLDEINSILTTRIVSGT